MKQKYFLLFFSICYLIFLKGQGQDNNNPNNDKDRIVLTTVFPDELAHLPAEVKSI